MEKFLMNQGTRIILAEGRANYVSLEPGSPFIDDQGREKYKLTVAMPKATFAKQKKYILAAINEAINVGVKKGHFKRALADAALKGKAPQFLLPFVDADMKMEMGEWQEQDALKDTICFTPWNKKPVSILGPDKMPITDYTEIYSGMWCLAHVSFFPYGKGRPKSGIGVYLNAVMKTRDDTPLDGSVSAETAFAEVKAMEDEGDDLE